MIIRSGTHLRMPCATGPLVEFSDGARLIIHSTQHPELGRSRCQLVYVLSVYVFFCEFPFFELILLITFATLISVLGFFLGYLAFGFCLCGFLCFAFRTSHSQNLTSNCIDIHDMQLLHETPKKWLPPELFSHCLGGFVPLQSLQKPYIHHFCSKFVDASLKMWDSLLQFISSEL